MTSLLKKSFKSSKCKTLAKLTVSRIKLMRNKKFIVVKQSRKDVAELLRNGQESNARIRVEHVHREESSLAAYELIEQYCEVIVSRLSTLQSQKVCPTDMKEPIASLMYAAQRCADLPELRKMRSLFILKYGKEFDAAASELRQDCGVNVQIIQSLSSHPPNAKTRLKLLKEIAAEHKIAWDSNEDISESFKLSEDLLDGPGQFVSASEVPQTNSTASPASRENSDSISSHPVIRSDLEGSSSPAAAHDARQKPSLSPYGTSFQVSKPRKHDSSSQDMSVSTRYEANTRSKSRADNGERLQEMSEVDIDAKGRAESSQGYKKLDNLGIQGDPHQSSLKLDSDPYARAKAEGRMDYRNISFKTQVNERQHDSEEKEKKIPKMQDRAVPYLAHPKDEEYRSNETQGDSQQTEEKDKRMQDYAVPHLAHPKEEEYQRSHEEVQDKTDTEMPVFSQEMQDANLKGHWRPPSLKLMKAYSIEAKNGGSPYPDFTTAAQVAFESAALAAEAAKAAIDLVKIDPRMKLNMPTGEADSFEMENEIKSKIRVEKVAQAMRNTHIEMGLERNLQRNEHEKKSPDRDDTVRESSTPIEEIVSPIRADVYSAVSQKPSEVAELHSTTGMDQELNVSGLDDCLGTPEIIFDEGKENFFGGQVISQGSGEKLQQIPKFDDYDSDEATDTDTPFFTGGRGALGKERYEQTISPLSVNKTKSVKVFSRIIDPIPFADHGSDSGEESAFENRKFKTKSSDRDFVQREEEGFAGYNYARKSELDNCDGSLQFPSESISEERLKVIDANSVRIMGKSSPGNIIAESNKYSKPDMVAHLRMKCQSSTSGSPSQSDELSSEADESHSINLHSHSGRGHKQGWAPEAREEKTGEKKIRHKLHWHSSDEFDNPSLSDEYSPVSDEFSTVKLSSQNADGQGSCKPDGLIEPQANRRSDIVEPYQVSKLLKGKPFYGESRRSIRTNRAQQELQSPSLAASYESANCSLPSILESARSDGIYHKI